MLFKKTSVHFGPAPKRGFTRDFRQEISDLERNWYQVEENPLLLHCLMKNIRTYALIAATLFAVSFPSAKAAAQTQQKSGGYMEYIIEGKDTIYIDMIRASKVFDRQKKKKGREWRKYYRLVYNFNKVYPFALEAKRLVAQVDSTVDADNLKLLKKEKYIKTVQDNLFKAYESTARSMSINQGALMMKLIDRECGITPYELIKDYRNGFAATFWQGVAKLFGSDMKKHYDPKGEDAATEELVKYWQDGDFEAFYYSIFWEYPEKTELHKDVAASKTKKK